MSYESKGYPAGYLSKKRHEHNQSRKGIGYKPSQFLTPLCQSDIKALPVVDVAKPTNFVPIAREKVGMFKHAHTFFRRILGK